MCDCNALCGVKVNASTGPVVVVYADPIEEAEGLKGTETADCESAILESAMNSCAGNCFCLAEKIAFETCDPWRFGAPSRATVGPRCCSKHKPARIPTHLTLHSCSNTNNHAKARHADTSGPEAYNAEALARASVCELDFDEMKRLDSTMWVREGLCV